MKIKPTLLGVFLLISTAASAQNWGGGVDDERVHFGFTFQYTSAVYKVFKKPDWNGLFDIPDPNNPGGVPATDKLKAVYSKPSAGFGIGLVINGRLSNNADVRLTPMLLFSDRIMQYDYVEPAVFNTAFSAATKKISATLVEFPLGIKIKSNRRNNFRAYMLYGAKYSLDIASKKKMDDTDFSAENKLLKNTRNYLSYEAGLGLDLYFEYFKMSPEIKWSSSLNNLLDNKQPNAFNAPLDKLTLRHVTFSLFFE